MVPERIGRYEVLTRLAAGGMAEVFLCALRGPDRFERLVVVKRILPHLVADARFGQMFVDEARNLARIAHPNVVQIYDFGRSGDELFLAMEYVEGENLAALGRALTALGEVLEPSLAAVLVADACAGLHAAHELRGKGGEALGLVHRDISPQNVVATYDGHVKVLDFGIAFTIDRTTRTETGAVKGKLEYMSPEQIGGRTMDRRSDIFSIGIVLYELVTGRRLYGRDGHGPVVNAICHEPLVPPSRLVACSPKLDDICMRALAKRPEDRYATAAEMRTELLEAARDLVDPTAALASTMRRLFEAQITEKNTLVAQFRSRPPVALEPTLVSGRTVTIGASSPSHPRRRRGSAIALLALVGVALCGVALLGAWRLWRGHAIGAATPAIAAASVSAPAPAPATSDGPTVAAAPIVVSIKTKPPGAHVSIDGEAKGDAPADLTIPRGSTPRTVVVELANFQTVTETVVPDRDQSLVFSLVPGKARPAARRSPAPRPSTSGFVRFE